MRQSSASGEDRPTEVSSCYSERKRAISAAQDARTPAARDAQTPAARDACIPAGQVAKIPAACDARIPAARDAQTPAAREARTPAARDAQTPAVRDAPYCGDDKQEGLLNCPKGEPPQPLSIKANMAWNSTGSLLFWFCQWLMTVFVVRLSSSYDAAGTLALAMAVYNTFSPLAVYRMFTYQISDVRHENSLGEYFAFRMITSGATLVVWAIYVLITCPPAAFWAIMAYIVSRLCRAFIDVLHGTMQLNGRMDYIGISNGLQGLVSIALFCTLFSATGSLELAFLAIAAATVLIGVAYDLPRALRFEPLKVRMSSQKAKHLLLICLPIVLATVAMQAVPTIPRQYLVFTMGEGALGAYASIAAPTAVIQMGASYIYNPVLSTLARDYQDGRRRAFTSLFAKTFGGIVAVGVVCGTALLALGPWLFEFMFGPSILEHLYLLMPVMALTVITGMVWFTNDVLIGIRRFRGMVVGNATALIVSIATSPLFIGSFGANGISFASIAGYCVGLCIMMASFRGTTK